MPSLSFWADYFRTMFVPHIDAFAGALSGRVLPAFDSIEEEGRRIEQEAYRELSRWSPYDDEPEPDFASAAEQARDQAITYWVTMYGVVQGVINLYAVGLWHLFEQQLAYFARHALSAEPWDPAPNPNFEGVRAELLQAGIDSTGLPSYAKVDELRLLANCAKHGDGPSCAALQALRPSLFKPPHHPEFDALPGNVPVIAPLGGEHLYLTAEAFKEYADAVKALWEELASKLEAI